MRTGHLIRFRVGRALAIVDLARCAHEYVPNLGHGSRCVHCHRYEARP